MNRWSRVYCSHGRQAAVKMPAESGEALVGRGKMEDKVRRDPDRALWARHPAINRRKGHAMKAFQLHEFGGPDGLKPAELRRPGARAGTGA